MPCDDSCSMQDQSRQHFGLCPVHLGQVHYDSVDAWTGMLILKVRFV